MIRLMACSLRGPCLRVSGDTLASARSSVAAMTCLAPFHRSLRDRADRRRPVHKCGAMMSAKLLGPNDLCAALCACASTLRRRIKLFVQQRQSGCPEQPDSISSSGDRGVEPLPHGSGSCPYFGMPRQFLERRIANVCLRSGQLPTAVRSIIDKGGAGVAPVGPKTHGPSKGHWERTCSLFFTYSAQTGFPSAHFAHIPCAVDNAQMARAFPRYSQRHRSRPTFPASLGIGVLVGFL